MINSSNFTNIIPSGGFDPRVGSASPMLAPSPPTSFDPRVGSSSPMRTSSNQGFNPFANFTDEQMKELAAGLKDNPLAQEYARANQVSAPRGGNFGVNRKPEPFVVPRNLMSAPLNMSYNPLIRTG